MTIKKSAKTEKPAKATSAKTDKPLKTAKPAKAAAVKAEKPAKAAKPAEKTVKPAASKAAPKSETAPQTPPPAVKPPVVAPKSTQSSAASSIENAKKELLLQREKSHAAHTEARRPIPSTPVNRTQQTTPMPRKPMTPSTIQVKPKPVEEKHKIHTKEMAPPAASVTAAAPVKPQPAPVQRKIQVQGAISVKDLAEKLSVRPTDLMQKLIKLGVFANINQTLNLDIAAKVSTEFGVELERLEAPAASPIEAAVAQKGPSAQEKARMTVRAPIVTFMGHVDHGKTSLLDAIRKTKVASGEAGGITQHIGAYEVFLPKGAVTFLDTPGHEAFTQMRARGARVTDVVVLVVASDDGVMPQTIEAIDHAKAANVPIIVAINKIDLPSANLERVKKGLMEHGLMSEDWGGKTIMVGVSAKTGKGIDDLLDMLVLESELLELKADPGTEAKGIVIEAELSKESGVLATVLVQDGTLRVGDTVVVGPHYCRVRAMINDRGQRIKEALPSMPVEILGLPGVPKAGDRFYVVKDERAAKEITDQVIEKAKEGRASHTTLEHLFEDIKAGKVEELKLVIKSDVQGSVEALRSTLGKIPSKNARLNIIHSGIGEVSESDVMLAAASDAVVIGFHVGISGAAKEIAEKEQVDVRFYEIIYEVKTAIEQAMEGLLAPELKEVFVGLAEVRQVFKVSKVGTIAGCSVLKGKIIRNHTCRVLRGGAKIHEGKVESLKRFKDDAREVLEGFECGIGVSGFDDLIVGDRIEAIEIQKKARKLE